MSDREVLDALTVLARRLGLLDSDERLAVESVHVPREALCLAPAPADSRSAGLLCSWDRSHLENTHSWSAAFVGIAAPRRLPENTGEPGTVCGVADVSREVTCILRTGHDGPHTGAVKDMAYDTWPQAEPCGFSAGPHLAGALVCDLPKGHRGDHGTRNWDDVVLTTDSPELRCGGPSPVQPGPDCNYLRGHRGAHSNDPTQSRAPGAPRAS